jgi:hypothetical protein
MFILVCVVKILILKAEYIYKDYPGPWIYWGHQIRWRVPNAPPVEIYVNENFNKMTKYQGILWWDKPIQQILRGMQQWNEVESCDFTFEGCYTCEEKPFNNDGKNVVGTATAARVYGAVAIVEIQNYNWNAQANRWDFVDVDIGYNEEETWSSRKLS